MRFFLVENGLIDCSGHHYMEARSFRKVAKQHGVQTLVLANSQARGDIRDELDAIPLFPSKPYATASDDPVSGPLESFIHLGKQIAFALNSLGDQGQDFRPVQAGRSRPPLERDAAILGHMADLPAVHLELAGDLRDR